MDNFDCTKVNAHFKKFMTCTAIWLYILLVCRRPENKLYKKYARIDGIEPQRIIFPKYLRTKFLLGGLQLLRTLKLRLCRGDNESRVWLTPYTGM